MIIFIQLFHLVILGLMKFSVPPEFFIYPYLIAKNWLPYTQIIDQHFPGIFLLPSGLTPQFFQLVLLLIVLTQSFWIYKISRSRLAVALFAVWQPFFAGNQLWIDTLIPLFTLPALYFFSSPVIAGLLLGTALLFKQSVLILILAALMFSRKKLRFLMASLLPISLTVIYFWSKGAAADFFFWTVKFNFLVYPGLARLWPTASDLVKLSLPGLLACLAIWKAKNHRLLLAFALTSLIGILPRFNLVHFQSAIPFFVILLSYFNFKKLILAASFIWVAFFIRHQFGPGRYQYFDSQTYALAAQIRNLTTPGESIFILGTQPHLYVLSDTVPSGSLFSFSLPWYLPLLEKKLLSTLPRLVIIDNASSVDGRPLSSYSPLLLNYIQSNYLPIYQIGSTYIYENRP